MFENIGGKIKGLAKIICAIGCIISIFFGFMIMRGGMAYRFNGIWSGLFVIVVGVLASWISCFALYGFGELIDTNAQIAEMLKKNNSKN